MGCFSSHPSVILFSLGASPLLAFLLHFFSRGFSPLCGCATTNLFHSQLGQLRARLAAKAKAQDYSNGTLTSGNVNDLLDKPSPLLSLVLAASDDVTALRKATAAATSDAPAPGENKGGEDHEAALALDSAGLAAAASRMEELQVHRATLVGINLLFYALGSKRQPFEYINGRRD